MAAKRQNNSRLASHIWRRIILLAGIMLLGILVITQFRSLTPSLESLKNASPTYVLLGLAITTTTFIVAAVMYQLLAMHRLRFGKTLLVQTASGFTNRLLPAGLGGMSLIVQYLHTERHTTSEAIAVVGADNVLGIIGHFSLFFLVVLTTSVSSISIRLPHMPRSAVIAIFLLVFLTSFIPRIRTRITSVFRRLSHDLGNYRKRPGHVILAFLNSLLLTILYVSILLVCTYAVGASLPFPKVLVAFTAGSIIGNVTPTPGGLVGTEAGLFGGFVLYGLSNETALATVLLYRLLTYWLPIIPGIFAFWIAERRIKLVD